MDKTNGGWCTHCLFHPITLHNTRLQKNVGLLFNLISWLYQGVFSNAKLLHYRFRIPSYTSKNECVVIPWYINSAASHFLMSLINKEKGCNRRIIAENLFFLYSILNGLDPVISYLQIVGRSKHLETYLSTPRWNPIGY